MSKPSLANSPSARTESWENEGGRVAPSQPLESLDLVAASLGVKRHMTETYSVGGFRYSNLADAIAQARRMARLERELS
jgi:hypothetical protein